MKSKLLILILIMPYFVKSQQNITSENVYKNAAELMLQNNSKLNIGGYGEVHFNQPLKKKTYQSALLDVHRLVMFLGYNFSSATQFVSEIEFEYAKELWVEQAFLQHRINKFVNFRTGLMLVPMGIINEYHEPTTFNGVERPVIDNKLALSTWREIGAGFSGTVLPLKIRYQAYMFGGSLSSYNEKAVFSGSKGLRDGRQKGSKAYASSPAFAGKIEYFGLKNLNAGFSFYKGNSQSTLYNGLNKDSFVLKKIADSSVIGISMLGADTRYTFNALQLRAQFYLIKLSNTLQYNIFTGTKGINNDLGSKMLGWYAEAAYNIFRHFPEINYGLIPFFRYEFYNLHHQVISPAIVNPFFKNTILTSGITFKFNENSAVKSDIQLVKSANSSIWNKTINFGFGIMF